MTNEILQLENVEMRYQADQSLFDRVLRRDPSVIPAVDGVSLTIEQNESHAVIGESGCGKSTLIELISGLHEPTNGEIQYHGKSISELSHEEKKDYQLNVQMIFQDPYNSLNPKFSVRESLQEPLKIHGIDTSEKKIIDICEKVELTPPEEYLDKKPFQLSGGERQRVSIGRALVVEPEVILADEPVSMLDVSTQASVLNLLSNLLSQLDVSLLYISHDLSTVPYVSEKLNVMYLGRIVESGPTHEILNNSMHPYTQALVNAVPIPDPHHDRERILLEGTAEHSEELMSGCRFRNRCSEVMEVCEQTPEKTHLSQDHTTACHLHNDNNESRVGETTKQHKGRN
ncbi:oligopeptide/dipeptide ABC transporter ATP-binding protein [Natrarchaeobius oligotrophus]|uniref:ABC transporter ATP-binding protein n=1 Tax=Natrarchaeobius chitinivorans TaxID=1679083 RepID=A0A3N6ML57_NATCH|nr:ABC transporter ATP-binding protein [Natrarchaeobius chitinivorans]RQG95056.1 ABC transporter ATP-binding protein [Natrarchaeobius chitinivorans]